jgi:hypothetical protein
MLQFLSGFTLAVAALTLAWAALVDALGNQSPPLELPAAASSGPPASPDQLTAVGEMLVTAEWFDLIFRGARKDKEPTSRLGSELAPNQGDHQPTRTGGTYKTLCVRLCDGFYFPISYSTSQERFASDAKQCENRCPSRSRLYVHRNPGGDVNDMVDMRGRLYRSLPTALLHRTQYVADCTCRGLPWEEEALARHRRYAEAAKQRIATKTAHRPPASQSAGPTRPKDRWARNE